MNALGVGLNAWEIGWEDCPKAGWADWLLNALNADGGEV